jgi:hypothetical protein
MFYVYVLRCKQDKFYVGKSKDALDRVTNHFFHHGSAWTKKYPPIDVVETFENVTGFDEDKVTKMYMHRYGINHVRGGAYANMRLWDYQLQALKDELYAIDDCCFTCKKPGHFAAECPTTIKRQRRMTQKAIIKNNRDLYGDLFS